MTEEERRKVRQQIAVSTARLAEIVDREEKKRQEIHRLRDEICVGIVAQQAYEQKSRQEKADLDAENMARKTDKMKAAMEKGDIKALEQFLRELV